MAATVFMVDDYVMDVNLTEITRALEEKGIRVVRGPKIPIGTKRTYTPQDYHLFRQADVLVFSIRSLCDRGVLEAASRARGVVYLSIGMETLDFAAAGEQCVVAANGAVPENVTSVAEANVMLILMLMHQPLKSMEVARGKLARPIGPLAWSQMLAKKTVGLLGFGRIGRAVAQRLSSFGVELLAHSPSLTQKSCPPYVTACSQKELLARSDVVGLYMAANASNRDMINRETLALMRPGSYLINTARGEVVDEDALYDALKSGHLAGAALDTYKKEPLAADHKLWELDNVLLLPHITGSTINNYRAITPAALENILRILNGEPPLYCANPAVLPQWREKHGGRSLL